MSERLERPTRPTLDQRISQALGNGKVAVDDLQQLLPPIEDGIWQSDQIAEQERARSLDPSVSPSDAEQAAQRAGVAMLKCQRYTTALVRLRTRLAEALQADYADKWHADADKVDRLTNDVAEKLARSYRECTELMLAALYAAEDANKEVDRINGSAPDNEHRRLSRVDLDWAKNLVLPNFHHPAPDHNLWPPPRPSFGASYAATMVPAYDPRYSADWAKAQAARAEAIREQQRRQGEFYDRMTREQEARQNAEERERFSRRQP